MIPIADTHVVLGARGAGKTRLVSRLLMLRPRDERWAVLLNDFGQSQLGSRTDDRSVVVREVSGCACCTAQVTMRVALTSVLRQERPQRILIEASAAAEPRAIIATLQEAVVTGAIHLERIVTVVNADQLDDPRFATNALYRSQISTADIVAVSSSNAARMGSARDALAELVSATTRIVRSEDVTLDVLRGE